MKRRREREKRGEVRISMEIQSKRCKESPSICLMNS
jgi:hypothetical protein